MEYRLLGRTNLNVSLIGFGTWVIGGKSLMEGQESGTVAIDQGQADKTLRFAFDKGINLFDIAGTYGNCEELIGRVFHNKREKIIIAAKMGLTSHGELNYNRENVEKEISRILRNIRSDYIDILQFITPQTYLFEAERIIDLLRPYVESQKIRHIGVSLHNFKQGISLVDNPDIDVFQVFCNLFDTRASKFIGQANNTNKGIIIKSPLNKGMLSGRYNENTTFPAEDIRSSYLKGDVLQKRLRWIAAFLEEFGIEKEQLFSYAVNYLRSKQENHSILFSFKTEEQIEQSLDAVGCEEFSDELVGRIEKFSLEKINILDEYFSKILDFFS